MRGAGGGGGRSASWLKLGRWRESRLLRGLRDLRDRVSQNCHGTHDFQVGRTLTSQQCQVVVLPGSRLSRNSTSLPLEHSDCHRDTNWTVPGSIYESVGLLYLTPGGRAALRGIGAQPQNWWWPWSAKRCNLQSLQSANIHILSLTAHQTSSSLTGCAPDILSCHQRISSCG